MIEFQFHSLGRSVLWKRTSERTNEQRKTHKSILCLRASLRDPFFMQSQLYWIQIIKLKILDDDDRQRGCDLHITTCGKGNRYRGGKIVCHPINWCHCKGLDFMRFLKSAIEKMRAEIIWMSDWNGETRMKQLHYMTRYLPNQSDSIQLYASHTQPDI